MASPGRYVTAGARAAEGSLKPLPFNTFVGARLAEQLVRQSLQVRHIQVGRGCQREFLLALPSNECGTQAGPLFPERFHAQLQLEELRDAGMFQLRGHSLA